MSRLNFAVEKNDAKTVKLLLNNKPNHGDFKMSNEMTPLHYADKNNNKEIDKLLMPSGCNASVNVKNKNGRTPLYFETVNGNVEMIKYLIANGSKTDLPASGKGQMELLHYLIQQSAEMGLKSDRDEIRLYFVVSNDHFQSVKYLLERGVCIYAKTLKNSTLLQLAIKVGHDIIVEVFLCFGAGIDSLVSENHSTVKFAVKMGRKNIMQLVLNKGVKDIKMNTKYDKRIVYVAVENTDKEIMKLLLKETASFGQINSIELFLKNSACTASKANLRETPLHFAAATGHVVAVKYLLDIGVHPQSLTRCPTFHSPVTYTLSKIVNGGIAAHENPLMIKKYCEITDLILSKSASMYPSDERNILNRNKSLIYAAQIKVFKENTSSPIATNATLDKFEKNKNMEFQPDILRCILNYEIQFMTDRCFQVLVINAIVENSRQLLQCLLEYDVHKWFNNIETKCLKCDSETILTIIDHIEDCNIIFKILLDFMSAGFCQEYSLLYILAMDTKTSIGILKLLIARLVQLRETSKKFDLSSTAQFFIVTNSFLCELYKKCEEQMMNSRTRKIHNDFNVTYFDVLSQPVDKVSTYVKHVELMKIMEMSWDIFPEYCGLLKRSIEKGKQRRELIDASLDSLLILINKNYKIEFPNGVVDEIFKYLSVVDLRRLEQAGKFV